MATQAKGFGPATVANVAVGFDLLGFAIEMLADEVKIEKINSPEVKITHIDGPIDGLEKIPRQAEANTATAGLLRLRQDLGLSFGFAVHVTKKIPLSSGLGGSAASAVAAVVAANALLDQSLPREKLLEYAMVGETIASGAAHGDNVAPCLFGGLIACRSLAPLDVISIPVPNDLFCVVVHPNQELSTREARAVLRKEIPLTDHIRQSSSLAGFLSGCFLNDTDLIGRSLEDVVVEPQRASLIRGFHEVKKAALGAGALGCSISGAGPSVFALTKGSEIAEKVKVAMFAAFNSAGAGPVRAWSSPIAVRGAWAE